MKNLIEEIEKIIEDLKIERQKCFEEIDYPLSQVDRLEGRILAYTDIVMCLTDYNIITAPKQIKLSEIVSKIQETMKEKLSVEEGMWCEKAIGYYINTWEDYDFDELVGFDKEMKIIHISLDTKKFKWLYTLWIAGTEIVDDLECDER